MNANANWRNPGFQQTDAHPVVCVSWNDAVKFTEWLSRHSGLNVRLPTEAQWEYACRGGTTTAYHWGDRPEDGQGWANVADASAKRQFSSWTTFSWDDGHVYTAPVGSFRANAFGLKDMHGNVWEWCADWYGSSLQGGVDPTGPSSGSSRVIRGGSWLSGPSAVRSADRGRNTPDYRDDYIGFRVLAVQ